MTCTFLGHRDTPGKIEPLLRSTLIDLIENKQVDEFYVGNQGNFDRMVRSNLKRLQSEYPHIRYAVVLAYMPGKNGASDYSDTIFPADLRDTPPKYAIIRRNRWMIRQSDYVIVYVKYAVGGASKGMEFAERNGKIVCNLADIEGDVQP